MGKPKVGIQAKEALLVAVSMHDRRVDRFILTETNLPRNIVSELVKKYGACLATASTFIPMTPASSGVRRDAPSGGAATVDATSKTSIISFLKVLKFCSAFVSAASDQGGSEDLDDSLIADEDPSCASLQSTVCGHFRDLFLRECVMPSLLENGEQQVLIVQSLYRSILLELSPSQSRNLSDPSSSPAAHLLCTPATALICENKELLQTILPRAGSVSRAVSISTLQLLSTLLGAASMSECCRLILSPEETPRESELSPSTPSKSLDIDMTLNKVISSSATKFGSIPWIGRCNPQGVRENCSTNYMEAGLDRILSRLAGGFHHQGSDSLLKIDPNLFPLNGSRPIGGPILELTKRKLSSFLTLKYDEQVAVTGLVEKCLTVLSTLLVLSGSDPVGNILLKLFIGLFESVSERITELSNHIKSLPDATQKLEIIYTVLNDPNCDPRYRRIIDSESAQVVRILETGLIVRELYREFEGSLLAVRQLRLVLIPEGSPGLISNIQTPTTASTASHYSTPSHHTPYSHINSSSKSPMSPFFSHTSPFSHAVSSSIHPTHTHHEVYYSDSEADEMDLIGRDYEEEESAEYMISDEDLEERFLHEYQIYENDLKSILAEGSHEGDEREIKGEDDEVVGEINDEGGENDPY